MNRSFVACAIALALLLPLGCVYSPTGPGILYMDVKGPMGPAKGTGTGKVGRACARTFLVLFAMYFQGPRRRARPPASSIM